MTQDQTDFFRTLLLRDLAETRRLSEEQAESVATVELDQARVGRLSRMDALQQQAVATSLRKRLPVRLRRLEAALDRLETGRFGQCCQCDAPIPAGRLKVDAAAPFCADCQEEIVERQFRA
jgi:DnaK suppressor protein